MATYIEFAQRIKSKYPQYKNVDDSTLAAKIIEKYPVYKNRITFEPSPQAETPPQDGFMGDIAKRKSNIYKAAGRTYEGKQTAPEYALQTTGEMVGGINDVLSRIAMGTAKKVLPESSKKTIKQGIVKVAESPVGDWAGKAAQKYGEFEKTSPRAAANINSLFNIASFLPVGKVGQFAAKGTASLSEKAGKSILASGLKIKDATAKIVASDVELGVKKIVGSIVKYDLGSPLKGYKGITAKAQSKIAKAQNTAETILKDAASDPALPKKNIDDVMLDLMVKAEKGTLEGIPLGEESKAINTLMTIHKGLELKGYKGELNALQLNNAKKAITEGRKLFKKGPAAIMEDPLAAKVNEIAYLRLRDEVEAIVPEVRKYNQTIYDLIPVVKATKEASKRTGNWNKIGLTDLLIAGPAGAASYATKTPEAIIGALSLMGARRLAGRGRGASALLKMNKPIEDMEWAQSLKRALGNQKGEMALGEKTYGLVPAIKSPESGKIYTGGGMTGHKGILNQKISRQEPGVEKSVWNELFKDNTGEYSPYIGFVDEQGNFIPRAEAEKILSSPKSLAMQFHDMSGSVKGLAPLAGVSGVAAGGLALSETDRGKKLLHKLGIE